MLSSSESEVAERHYVDPIILGAMFALARYSVIKGIRAYKC